MLLPKKLQPSPHLAVLAVSSPSELPRIEEGANRLRARGARVTLANNIAHFATGRGYLAGDDDERVAELNRFLRDPQYDAFLFARGGYGAMRILDAVDYDAIRENPRPIIGFSDVTALHQAISLRTGVRTFHGPMVNLDFFNGLSPQVEEWFWSMLVGEAPLTWHFDESQVFQHGDAEGTLFGGCLSLTTSLLGTSYDYWIDDGIWFWEDVDEKLYSIDRMLTHLRLSARFRNIRGVIIGKLKGCGSDDEIAVLLRDFFAPLGIPVIRHFPFGHEGDNLLMPIGARVRLESRSGSFTVLEPAVRG